MTYTFFKVYSGMNMKQTAGVLTLILTLLVGVLLGYTIGVSNIHKEAVANNAGRWVAVDNCNNMFAWGNGDCCSTRR